MTTTTLNLTEEELAEVIRLTGQSVAGEAITTAAREYVRYAQRMELKRLSGQVTMEKRSLAAAEGSH